MKVKITSGPFAGRFIGPNIYGMVTNPMLREHPQIGLTGLPYSLYVQVQAATGFIETKAREVQAILKQNGLDSELVP